MSLFLMMSLERLFTTFCLDVLSCFFPRKVPGKSQEQELSGSFVTDKKPQREDRREKSDSPVYSNHVRSLCVTTILSSINVFCP